MFFGVCGFMFLFFFICHGVVLFYVFTDTLIFID